MSSTTLTIRLPAPLRNEIVARAESAGISAGAAARELISAAIEGDALYGAAERGARAGARAGIEESLNSPTPVQEAQ